MTTEGAYEPVPNRRERSIFGRSATGRCEVCKEVLVAGDDVACIDPTGLRHRTCHCGKPVHIHTDLDGFTRGLCKHCDEVRCDVAPEQKGEHP